MRRTALAWIALVALAAGAAEFGHPGGPEPGNLDEVGARLRADGADMELLISFGTSKGGSAGHLALALRRDGEAEETVHSANFYADRAAEHAKGYYNAELMTRIPKSEYLFRTRSTLGDD